MLNKGCLIAIEGIDGSGKTTIAKKIVEWLNERNIKALYTSEPTRSPIGLLIKDKIISAEKRQDARIEALLFAADRLWHVINEILPSLSKNIIVVTDRYYFSSIAYQGALGAPISWIKELNKFAPKPDLSIYIDITPEEAIRRKSRQGDVKKLFENIRYLSKVREIYLDMVRNGELTLINGMEPLEKVIDEALALVKKLLFPRGSS
ncbi:MAG: dTMP kinase [Desulfurococcales archaeon ex4484_217_2]|nr:MAG: dTMP kinase [Desulfurococcales archaeon ex4484_217_2]